MTEEEVTIEPAPNEAAVSTNSCRKQGEPEMAWETRNGRGRYLTRSKRVGDRVEREYLGTGDVAELIALKDEERRELREAVRIAAKIAFRDKTAPIEMIEKNMENLHKILNTELERHFDDKGYYYHRGSWRKRRTA